MADGTRVEWTQAVSRSSTSGFRWAIATLLVCLIGAEALPGQGPDGENQLRLQAAGAAGPRLAWRRVGTSARVLGLASTASGPVSRVWFDAGGALLAQLPGGQVYESKDSGMWVPAQAPVPEPAWEVATPGPEAGARVRSARLANVAYAAGAHVWRSNDGGVTWANQTAWRGSSLLGPGVQDLAIDPANPDRVAVATGAGVWLTQDGGRSWNGLNDALPALQVRRILETPRGPRGLQIGVEEAPGFLTAWEWAPGRRDAWVESAPGPLSEEEEWKSIVSRAAGASITTATRRGQVHVGGSLDGRLWTSTDNGVNWRVFEAGEDAGAVQRIWVSPDGRAVLAALSGAASGKGRRVLRSLNGGQWWDDLTADLPDGPAYGIAADPSTGAIYVASRSGVYFTINSLQAPAPATPWIALRAGLPPAAARDVRLDPLGHHLFTAIDGYGVFAMTAPHRFYSPQLASAADFGMRSVAPGGLLTLIGARLSKAAANEQAAPVLAANESESQVQLPFGLEGETMRLTLNWGSGDVQVGLPLREAAPAVLVDREGTPMVLDAESGLQCDASMPVRPGSRLQILATGLGRVEPAWPAGLAAPLDNPPRVLTRLQVFLSGQRAEVTRAVLAPGYIGYYLVEIEVPALLDRGPAELWVAAAGNESNRVRVYVEQ